MSKVFDINKNSKEEKGGGFIANLIQNNDVEPEIPSSEEHSRLGTDRLIELKEEKLKKIKDKFQDIRKFNVMEVEKLIRVTECINVNQNKLALNTLYLCSCQNNREFLVCEACKDTCHKGHGILLKVQCYSNCKCAEMINHYVGTGFVDIISQFKKKCFYQPFFEYFPNHGFVKKIENAGDIGHEKIKNFCSVCFEVCLGLDLESFQGGDLYHSDADKILYEKVPYNRASECECKNHSPPSLITFYNEICGNYVDDKDYIILNSGLDGVSQSMVQPKSVLSNNNPHFMNVVENNDNKEDNSDKKTKELDYGRKRLSKNKISKEDLEEDEDIILKKDKRPTNPEIVEEVKNMEPDPQSNFEIDDRDLESSRLYGNKEEEEAHDEEQEKTEEEEQVKKIPRVLDLSKYFYNFNINFASHSTVDNINDYCKILIDPMVNSIKYFNENITNITERRKVLELESIDNNSFDHQEKLLKNKEEKENTIIDFYTNFYNQKSFELINTFMKKYFLKFSLVQNPFHRKLELEEVINAYSQNVSLMDYSEAEFFYSSKFRFAYMIFIFYIRKYILEFNNTFNCFSYTNMNIINRILLANNSVHFTDFYIVSNNESGSEKDVIDRTEAFHNHIYFKTIVQKFGEVLTRDMNKCNIIYKRNLHKIYLQNVTTYVKIFNFLIKYNLICEDEKVKYLEMLNDITSIFFENYVDRHKYDEESSFIDENELNYILDKQKQDFSDKNYDAEEKEYERQQVKKEQEKKRFLLKNKNNDFNILGDGETFPCDFIFDSMKTLLYYIIQKNDNTFVYKFNQFSNLKENIARMNQDKQEDDLFKWSFKSSYDANLVSKIFSNSIYLFSSMKIPQSYRKMKVTKFDFCAKKIFEILIGNSDFYISSFEQMQSDYYKRLKDTLLKKEFNNIDLNDELSFDRFKMFDATNDNSRNHPILQILFNSYNFRNLHPELEKKNYTGKTELNKYIKEVIHPNQEHKILMKYLDDFYRNNRFYSDLIINFDVYIRLIEGLLMEITKWAENLKRQGKEKELKEIIKFTPFFKRFNEFFEIYSAKKIDKTLLTIAPECIKKVLKLFTNICDKHIENISLLSTFSPNLFFEAMYIEDDENIELVNLFFKNSRTLSKSEGVRNYYFICQVIDAFILKIKSHIEYKINETTDLRMDFSIMSRFIDTMKILITDYSLNNSEVFNSVMGLVELLMIMKDNEYISYYLNLFYRYSKDGPTEFEKRVDREIFHKVKSRLQNKMTDIKQAKFMDKTQKKEAEQMFKLVKKKSKLYEKDLDSIDHLEKFMKTSKQDSLKEQILKSEEKDKLLQEQNTIEEEEESRPPPTYHFVPAETLKRRESHYNVLSNFFEKYFKFINFCYKKELNFFEIFFKKGEEFVQLKDFSRSVIRERRSVNDHNEIIQVEELDFSNIFDWFKPDLLVKFTKFAYNSNVKMNFTVSDENNVFKLFLAFLSKADCKNFYNIERNPEILQYYFNFVEKTIDYMIQIVKDLKNFDMESEEVKKVLKKYEELDPLKTNLTKEDMRIIILYDYKNISAFHRLIYDLFEDGVIVPLFYINNRYFLKRDELVGIDYISLYKINLKFAELANLFYNSHSIHKTDDLIAHQSELENLMLITFNPGESKKLKLKAIYEKYIPQTGKKDYQIKYLMDEKIIREFRNILYCIIHEKYQDSNYFDINRYLYSRNNLFENTYIVNKDNNKIFNLTRTIENYENLTSNRITYMGNLGYKFITVLNNYKIELSKCYKTDFALINIFIAGEDESDKQYERRVFKYLYKRLMNNIGIDEEMEYNLITLESLHTLNYIRNMLYQLDKIDKVNIFNMKKIIQNEDQVEDFIKTLCIKVFFPCFFNEGLSFFELNKQLIKFSHNQTIISDVLLIIRMLCRDKSIAQKLFNTDLYYTDSAINAQDLLDLLSNPEKMNEFCRSDLNKYVSEKYNREIKRSMDVNNMSKMSSHMLAKSKNIQDIKSENVQDKGKDKDQVQVNFKFKKRLCCFSNLFFLIMRLSIKIINYDEKLILIDKKNNVIKYSDNFGLKTMFFRLSEMLIEGINNQFPDDVSYFELETYSKKKFYYDLQIIHYLEDVKTYCSTNEVFIFKENNELKYYSLKLINTFIIKKDLLMSFLSYFVALFDLDFLVGLAIEYTKILVHKYHNKNTYNDRGFNNGYKSIELSDHTYDSKNLYKKLYKEYHLDSNFLIGVNCFKIIKILSEKHKVPSATLMLQHQDLKKYHALSSREKKIKGVSDNTLKANFSIMKTMRSMKFNLIDGEEEDENNAKSLSQKSGFTEKFHKNYFTGEKDKVNLIHKYKEAYYNINRNPDEFTKFNKEEKDFICKFYDWFVNKVEFINEKEELQEVYYEVGPETVIVTSDEIQEMTLNANYSSKGTKIISFIHFIDKMKMKIRYFRKYKGVFPDRLHQYNELKYKHFDVFSLIISIIICVLQLCYYNNDDHFYYNTDSGQRIYIVTTVLGGIQILSNILAEILFFYSRFFFSVKSFEKLNGKRFNYNVMNKSHVYFYECWLTDSDIFLVNINLIIGIVAITRPFMTFLYSLQLITVLRIFKTVREIFMAFEKRISQVIVMILFLAIIVNFFSSIGYYGLNDFFIFNNIKRDGDDTYENGCESLIVCFITHFKEGIMNGGGVGDILDNPRYNPNTSQYYQLWFYNMFFFIICILLVLNMINGIIINAFTDIRESDEEHEIEAMQKCFLCSISEDTFQKNNLSLKKHIKDVHKLKSYIHYLIQILLTPDKDLDDFGEYLKKQLINKELKIFPIGRTKELSSPQTE